MRPCGAPWPIPGKVEAEDFDAGAGTFSDTTPANQGDAGAYRSTSVDISTCTDIGGGFHLSSVEAGEWTEYTVNVAATGYYNVIGRVADSSGGGSFRVEFDGVDRTGAIAFGSTGGQQQWTNVRKVGAYLNAGIQVMRVVWLEGANLNYLRFEELPTYNNGGLPWGLGRIEAEDFDNGADAYSDTGVGNQGGQYRTGSGVDVEVATDVGTG